VVRAGISATAPGTIGGVTNVGDIVTASRPLIVVDSRFGGVSAIDMSVNPPAVIPIALGGSQQGVSVTPDGSKALVSSGGITVYDLTTNPPSSIGDIPLFGTATSAITSDGRFAVATWRQAGISSMDSANKSIISSVNLPFGNSLAVTPDNTTVIVADNSNNVFRILALSPQGILSDTGKTVPYNLAGLSANFAMAPNGRFALFASGGNSSVGLLRIDSMHNVTLSGTTIPICCQQPGVGPGAWGVAITPDGSKAYVTNIQSSDVAVLSIDATDKVTDTGVRVAIPNGVFSGFNGGPSGIAIALDGKAYIANTVKSTITIVDTKTDTVVGTVAVPLPPSGIGVPR
jgi:DNA-binding beta-propeller fold protein YncE